MYFFKFILKKEECFVKPDVRACLCFSSNPRRFNEIKQIKNEDKLPKQSPAFNTTNKTLNGDKAVLNTVQSALLANM